MHYHTAWGQWAVQFLHCTAIPSRDSGQWNSCNSRAHQLGDGESCPEGGCCLKTELLRRTATLPGGSGQCKSCNRLPHGLGAVGSATPAMHFLFR